MLINHMYVLCTWRYISFHGKYLEKKSLNLVLWQHEAKNGLERAQGQLKTLGSLAISCETSTSNSFPRFLRLAQHWARYKKERRNVVGRMMVILLVFMLRRRVLSMLVVMQKLWWMWGEFSSFWYIMSRIEKEGDQEYFNISDVKEHVYCLLNK